LPSRILLTNLVIGFPETALAAGKTGKTRVNSVPGSCYLASPAVGLLSMRQALTALTSLPALLSLLPGQDR
jgi:hypothetical protein